VASADARSAHTAPMPQIATLDLHGRAVVSVGETGVVAVR
jgi:hypothetical protein